MKGTEQTLDQIIIDLIQIMIDSFRQVHFDAAPLHWLSAMSSPPLELVELVEFLASPKPDVRKEAVALVEGLSGSDEGCATLGQVAATLLPALLSMLWGHDALARASAAALANLSRHPDLVPTLLSTIDFSVNQWFAPTVTMSTNSTNSMTLQQLIIWGEN